MKPPGSSPRPTARRLDDHPGRSLPPLAPAVYRRELPNGVRLLVLPTGSPAAAIAVRMAAGFLDEADEQVGISHVLEHMVFKGAPDLGPGALAQRIKAVGGYVNAFTAYDATQYWAVLPPDGIPVAADLLARSVCRPTIDGDELFRELRVIAEEVRRKRDTPSAMAQEILHETLFDRHRIRRWRIGDESVVEAFTREAVLAFHATHYVPARTIVSVAGGVDGEATLAMLEHLWDDWHAAGASRNTGPGEATAPGVRARTLEGDTAAIEWRVGWRAPGPLHPDADPLALAAAILGVGRGSRLWGALRTPGLATSVTAGFVPAHDVGVIALGATVPTPSFAAVPGALAAEVAGLVASGPSAEELERARSLMLARHAGMRESVEALAGSLAAAEDLRDVALLDEERQRLETMTAEEVRSAASRWMLPDQVAAVGHGPVGGPSLAAEALAATFRDPPRPRGPAGLPAAPTRQSRGARTGATPYRVELSAGQLLCWPRRSAGLVFIGCYVPRHEPEDAATAGLGALALHAALRGAGGLDEGQLALAIERLGGTLRPRASHDVLGVGATVLSACLGDAARLIAAVIDAPELADAGVRSERDALLAEAAQARDDMGRWPYRLALGAAWGDRGYGLPVSGTEASLPGLGTDQVRAWHREAFATARTVVVAGDVDPDEAVRLAESLVRGATGVAPREGRTAAAWGTWQPGSERQEARARHQTALALAFPGPHRRDPDRHAADVWAAVASGLGGRLFESLRSARSLAYSVQAGATTWRHGGVLTAYLATSPEREAEARDALAEELAGFRDAVPSAEEIERATRYIAGQMRVGRQRTVALAGELLDAGLLGEGVEELIAPWERVLAVGPGDVHRVSASLAPDLGAVGVVRGVPPA